jgi:hypothetical protein
MVIHVKFIAVFGRGNQKDIQSFLYDHTKLLEGDTLQESGDKIACVLRTEAPTDYRAMYHADYQANRLKSGLYAARVSDTLQEAMENLQEMWF